MTREAGTEELDILCKINLDKLQKDTDKETWKDELKELFDFLFKSTNFNNIDLYSVINILCLIK